MRCIGLVQRPRVTVTQAIIQAYDTHTVFHGTDGALPAEEFLLKLHPCSLERCLSKTQKTLHAVHSQVMLCMGISRVAGWLKICRSRPSYRGCQQLPAQQGQATCPEVLLPDFLCYRCSCTRVQTHNTHHVLPSCVLWVWLGHAHALRMPMLRRRSGIASLGNTESRPVYNQDLSFYLIQRCIRPDA